MPGYGNTNHAAVGVDTTIRGHVVVARPIVVLMNDIDTKPGPGLLYDTNFDTGIGTAPNLPTSPAISQLFCRRRIVPTKTISYF